MFVFICFDSSLNFVGYLAYCWWFWLFRDLQLLDCFGYFVIVVDVWGLVYCFVWCCLVAFSVVSFFSLYVAYLDTLVSVLFCVLCCWFVVEMPGFTYDFVAVSLS